MQKWFDILSDIGMAIWEMYGLPILVGVVSFAILLLIFAYFRVYGFCVAFIMCCLGAGCLARLLYK